MSRRLSFFGNEKELTEFIRGEYRIGEFLIIGDREFTDSELHYCSVSEWLKNPNASDSYKAVGVISDSGELIKEVFLTLFDYQGNVCALRTDYHWYRNPIFVISPPKSGTHLLLKLVENFGYKEGGILPIDPEYGKWYSLDSASVHTSAHEYFRRKNIQGDLHGGRLHAFNHCRGIVMYRHPRDVFRSALNYNFDPHNTVFGNYMAGSSRAEKLDALLNKDSIAGDLAHVLNDMSNWALFPNILSVGFEEFSAKEGLCSQPVWEMQLLFHIDGSPDDILKRSFGNSDTFREGSVFKEDEVIDSRLKEISQATGYYLKQLGYSDEDPDNNYFRKLRKRGVVRKDYRPIDKPIRVMLTESYVVWFLNNRFYAKSKLYSENYCKLMSRVDRSLYFSDSSLENIRFRINRYESTNSALRFFHAFVSQIYKIPLFRRLFRWANS